jgi:hypothetical protein
MALFSQASLRDGLASHAATDAPIADDNAPPSERGPDLGAGNEESRDMGYALLRDLLPSDPGPAASFWLDLDRALLEHAGISLDGLFAPLIAASRFRFDNNPSPIRQMSVAKFVDHVTTWSGLPRADVAAGTAHLTLTCDDIRAEGVRHWHLEQRTHRLATHPFIEVEPGQLLILPLRADFTIDVFLRYLADRRLPWPQRAVPAAVHRLVATHRADSQRQLERDVAAACAAAGLAVRANLTIAKAQRADLRLVGEIDCLAVDAARRRIWVLEAKHLQEAFGTLDIAANIAAVYGTSVLHSPRLPSLTRPSRKAPPATQLDTNTAAIRQNVPAAVWLAYQQRQTATADAARKAAAAGTRWEVIPMFVSEHLEVAGFLRPAQHAWTRLVDLPTVLTADTPPEAGFFAPH